VRRRGMSLEELLESGAVPTMEDITEEELVKLFRKFRGLEKKQERDQAFWAATNENLKIAYEKLDEKDRELGRAYAIIQDDLSVASKIQRALLPEPTKKMTSELELAVYHKQLAEVGGDYYDFFNTCSGSYAIGVFDISGHGVSAALVMTYLKAQFMTILETLESPKEIVDWVNNISYDFLKTVKKYATVNFVVMNTTVLRYVSGGGFGFLLSGKKSTVFEKRDAFLGLRRRPFHEYELPFKKGDLLAMYTDGIVEAQNESGEDYSVQRLNDLIVKNAKKPVKDILKACMDDYTKFRNKDSDDITLLILRKKV
jgi:sigma-B regulation protein RsbU (phosphoserine phosphatase)